MKVGFNFLFLLPGKVGGTETYTRGIIEALEALDKENSYLIFCNRENYNIFKFKSKNFQKVKSPVKAVIRPLRILWEQFVLPIQVWFKKVDILFSLGYVCPFFVPCKSVVVIYDLNWFFHPEEFSFLQRFAWRALVTLSAPKADHVITSSKNSKKDIARVLGISRDKISVVYGGVDERFRPMKDKRRISAVKKKYGVKDKFVLTVSAAYKFKNLGRLLDAFKEVEKKFPRVQLLIVGLGGRGRPEIMKKIKKHGFKDKVIIAGWVPDEDIPILYSAAEVYVHPSLYEGFGFPVLEAMACGCPVISSKLASLPELVGDSAILVNALSVHQIAEAILKVVGDQRLRQSLKIKGFRQAKKFSWKNSSILFQKSF